MPMYKKMLFQESMSMTNDHLMFFNDHLMIINLMILIFILYWCLKSIFFMPLNYYIKENNKIEIFWTLIPMMILSFSIFPSMMILFFMEENYKNSLNMKIMGNQWYWEYEYSKNKINFDSYMKKSYKNRLLKTNNSLIMPMMIPISLFISSNDVIHSWSLPSISLKSDAIPGRINMMNMIIKKPGILTGQCSEICGMNHSFMPINVFSINMKNFLNLLSSKS